MLYCIFKIEIYKGIEDEETSVRGLVVHTSCSSPGECPPSSLEKEEEKINE
jgi:hypothetical protein